MEQLIIYNLHRFNLIVQNSECIIVNSDVDFCTTNSDIHIEYCQNQQCIREFLETNNITVINQQLGQGESVWL